MMARHLLKGRANLIEVSVNWTYKLLHFDWTRQGHFELTRGAVTLWLREVVGRVYRLFCSLLVFMARCSRNHRGNSPRLVAWTIEGLRMRLELTVEMTTCGAGHLRLGRTTVHSAVATGGSSAGLARWSSLGHVAVTSESSWAGGLDQATDFFLFCSMAAASGSSSSCSSFRSARTSNRLRLGSGFRAGWFSRDGGLVSGGEMSYPKICRADSTPEVLSLLSPAGFLSMPLGGARVRVVGFRMTKVPGSSHPRTTGVGPDQLGLAGWVP